MKNQTKKDARDQYFEALKGSLAHNPSLEYLVEFKHYLEKWADHIQTEINERLNKDEYECSDSGACDRSGSVLIANWKKHL